jgi:squalene-hopene/tetraprenyl-beta-curcumene cyclase
VISQWLLDQQYTEIHPFTNAAPGGWAWTNLSGGVPDADDTPGAMLALLQLEESGNPQVQKALREATRWLLDLQNRDGGWPTFCRGWGRLPFDRSGADLTAHALRALRQWRIYLNTARVDGAVARGFRFLEAKQRADGSWVPLWFGNQDHPAEENPVYGTAKVLLAYRDYQQLAAPPAKRALDWMVQHQGDSGGWGESFEETALAVEALLGCDSGSAGETEVAIEKGLEWLIRGVEEDRHRNSSPIGFYFAKLWYYEALYPLTFTVSALGLAARRFAEPARATDTPLRLPHAEQL